MDADGPAPKVLLADKGYDADFIRDDMEKRGGTAMVPTKRNRIIQLPVDAAIYALRNMVERCFNKLKNARRLATRYDKTADSYLGFIHIVSIRLWMRQFVNASYVDELKDLWSANDQMLKVVKKMTTKASDPTLGEMLAKSQEGIAAHTAILKELIAGQDEKVSKEHCKGMEGLAAEATKHVLEEGPKKGPILDVLIIAQYQRMTVSDVLRPRRSRA
jgi:transposase